MVGNLFAIDFRYPVAVSVKFKPCSRKTLENSWGSMLNSIHNLLKLALAFLNSKFWSYIFRAYHALCIQKIKGKKSGKWRAIPTAHSWVTVAQFSACLVFSSSVSSRASLTELPLPFMTANICTNFNPKLLKDWWFVGVFPFPSLHFLVPC